jgi:hypothetical protein
VTHFFKRRRNAFSRVAASRADVGRGTQHQIPDTRPSHHAFARAFLIDTNTIRNRTKPLEKCSLRFSNRHGLGASKLMSRCAGWFGLDLSSRHRWSTHSVERASTFASGYEPESREFDSLRARHFPQAARNKVGYLILRGRVSISRKGICESPIGARRMWNDNRQGGRNSQCAINL